MTIDKSLVAAAGRRFNTSTVRDLSVIAGVWVVLVAIANPAGEFPLNDDWVYALSVKALLETGEFRFPSPSSANVGPQIWWGALFCLPGGFSFTALRLSTLTAGLVALFELYLLVRHFTADRLIALVGALALAVNPVYFALCNSFMTDVPALCLALIAIRFFVRGLDDRSDGRIAVSVAFLVAAVLVRQLTLVVAFSFAVIYFYRRGASVRSGLMAILIAVLPVVVHVWYQRWLVASGRTQLLTFHSDVYSMVPSLDGLPLMFKVALNALLYTGLFAIPLVLFVWNGPAALKRLKASRAAQVVVALAVTFFSALLVTGKMMPTGASILMKSGIGPLTLLDTYTLRVNLPEIPAAVALMWVAVTVLSIAALVVVLDIVARAARTPALWRNSSRPDLARWPLLLAVAVAATYFLVLVGVAGKIFIFDRYFLLFFPLVVVAVGATCCSPEGGHQRKSSPLSRRLSFASLAFFGVFSVVATHDYLAWNRVRWLALSDLTRDGRVRANQLDGGYEFNGWYLNDAKYQPKEGKSWWWVDDDEYVVASGPLPNYREVRRYPFRRWLLQTENPVLVLQRARQ